MRRTAVGDYLYFLTLTVHEWTDVFTRVEYKDFIVDQLNFCINKKGLEVFTYVIMTNHIHMIARCKEGYNLSDIIRDFKTFTSKRMIELIEGNNKESRKENLLSIFKKENKNKFWKDENYPFRLYNSETLKQKIYYIHENPVKTGIVDESWKYKYSSANPESPVKINFI